METQNLQQLLYLFAQPSEEEMKQLLDKLQVMHVAKKDFVHKAGETCDKLFFITKGIAKHYYEDDSNQGTIWITFANSFLTVVSSFVTGTPSRTNIIAVTDMELIYISRNDLYTLYDNYKVWERMGRMIAEFSIIGFSERAYSLQFRTAKERYEQFIQQHPEALQHVPLGDIASFLGIAQETLSRIRGGG